MCPRTENMGWRLRGERENTPEMRISKGKASPSQSVDSLEQSFPTVKENIGKIKRSSGQNNHSAAQSIIWKTESEWDLRETRVRLRLYFGKGTVTSGDKKQPRKPFTVLMASLSPTTPELPNATEKGPGDNEKGYTDLSKHYVLMWRTNTHDLWYKSHLSLPQMPNHIPVIICFSF